jgi:hypothetical protein
MRVEDILDAIARIERYVEGLSFDSDFLITSFSLRRSANNWPTPKVSGIVCRGH